MLLSTGFKKGRHCFGNRYIDSSSFTYVVLQETGCIVPGLLFLVQPKTVLVSVQIFSCEF